MKDPRDEKANGIFTPDNSYGGFKIQTDQCCLVDSTGNSFPLRAQSFAVLQMLEKHSDKVVTKDQLMQAVWSDVRVTDDSLIKCISDIRKAIGDVDHAILRTVPRQGYMLVPDTSAVDLLESGNAANYQKILRWAMTGAVLLIVGFSYFVHSVKTASEELLHAHGAIAGTPTLKITDQSDDGGTLRQSSDVMSQLGVSLSRYRTVRVVDSPDADYELVIRDNTAGNRLTGTLSAIRDKSLVFAQSFERSKNIAENDHVASRIAAAIASPGVGALDRELMEKSRLKPIEEITHAECFAHGFGCAKCSGEEDNITKRAEACLAHILDTDPDNARAWALQATILAHQYWWGNTLSEPLRSNVNLRKHLPDKAIAAANRAEALSTGNDSSIYWGMAEAYYSSCQPDKLYMAIQRGLQLSPDDPNLLASFGNWLSYSGRWEEGSALTQRALELEPQFYRKWWWMGIAKPLYFKEDFQGAYDAFLKAFNERNWISQLQLAYTLPHLDRLEEARQAVANVEHLYPGITLERALEQYKILCFPDEYLVNMKSALIAAGLPSRGKSTIFSSISLPRAMTLELDNYVAEYIDVGQGTPIVFVHGSLSDYHSWGQYLAPVSEKHRFISYSRRYHGTQDWNDNGERYTTAQHTQDLIDFVEALDLGPVHIVTWSSGFGPAHHASIQRPDLFSSLIHFEPVDPALFTDQPLDMSALGEWEQRWSVYDEAKERGDVEAQVARFIEIVFELAPGGFHEERETQQETNRRNGRTLAVASNEADDTRFTINCAVAAQTTVPTLIVNGALSHYFFKRQSEIATHCIPNAKSRTIAGVNHRGPLDAASEFSDIITDFVSSH